MTAAHATRAQTLRQSRSIIANRLNPFATLYDPDSESAPTDSGPIDPKVIIDESDRVVSLPMFLSNRRYTGYRIKRQERCRECFYCGKPLSGRHGISLDHLIPQSRGGKDVPWNLVLSCSDCNNDKSDATPVEWLAEIEAQVAAMQAKADRLRELIEEHDLGWFTATVPRVDSKAKAKADSKAFHEARAAEEAARDANPGASIRQARFFIGRNLFSIYLNGAEGRRRLISGLRAPDLLHYLQGVEFDSSWSICIVAEQIWNPREEGVFN